MLYAKLEIFYYFRKLFNDIHLKILSDKSDINEIEF